MNPPGDVTRLLAAWTAGDPHAQAELMPLVYDELRRIARQQWSLREPGQTLQPTALIHEAYLKLARHGKPFQNRTHFFALAATAMRQVLVNHAKASLAGNAVAARRTSRSRKRTRPCRWKPGTSSR